MNAIAAPVLTAPALAQAVMRGERRAIAQAINLIERNAGDSAELLDALRSRVGRAYRIGVTGPPGAGKSTLVARLAAALRLRGQSVAVIAVDPTSPFSGGALLGDRVRMSEIWGDDRVFIRSMAAREALGGLAARTIDVADILDAAAFDVILLETVGVGQSELDVAQAADTTVVMLTPESGDEVQAAKAGLMEIAQVFVLNKCDRPGSDRAFAAIRAMLNLRSRDLPPGEWLAALVRAAAEQGSGVDDTLAAIDKHREYQQANQRLRRRRIDRARRQVLDLVAERVRCGAALRLSTPDFARRVEQIVDGIGSPRTLADDLSKGAEQ
jgi:LAO/AO transport system kinase